jgi:hypothetical protein
VKTCRPFCLGLLVLFLPKHLIIWFSNLSILSVHDEGYFRNASKFDIYVFIYMYRGGKYSRNRMALYEDSDKQTIIL